WTGTSKFCVCVSATAGPAPTTSRAPAAASETTKERFTTSPTTTLAPRRGVGSSTPVLPRLTDGEELEDGRNRVASQLLVVDPPNGAGEHHHHVAAALQVEPIEGEIASPAELLRLRAGVRLDLREGSLWILVEVREALAEDALPVLTSVHEAGGHVPEPPELAAVPCSHRRDQPPPVR